MTQCGIFPTTDHCYTNKRNQCFVSNVEQYNGIPDAPTREAYCRRGVTVQLVSSLTRMDLTKQ